jgi:hypothetical protein
MITEEQINALIAHCKRQKEKSFSRLIRDEHSDTLECLEELLYLIKSTKWHDLKENPNDLPKIDTTAIIANESFDYPLEAKWDGENWSYGKWDEIATDVIAWHEMPQFKKEDKQWKL